MAFGLPCLAFSVIRRSNIKDWRRLRGPKKVTKEKIFQHYAEQLKASLDELVESNRWKEQLRHLQEIRIIHRQMDILIDHLDNKIRLRCLEQTGLRTVERYWPFYKEKDS